MGFSTVFDAISTNVPYLPRGPHAGYTTGGGYIEWSTAQWQHDPGALRICQNSTGSDSTADVFDIESGGGSPSAAADWAKRAYAAFIHGTRPGQRHPCVYSAGGTVGAIANAISAAKLPFHVNLWLARPGISAAAAQAEVMANPAGILPMVGVQFAWPGYGLPANGTYDESEFLTSWLTLQSGVLGDVIAIGNSGPAVLAAQKLLHQRDTLLSVTADGLFGPGTQTAVETYQKLKGLKPDGIVGSATWAALAAPVTPPPVVVPPVKPPVKPPVVVPPPPAKPSPAPGRTHTAMQSAGSVVVLSWTPVAFASKYHVQVEEIPAGATPDKLVVDTETTELKFAQQFNPRTKYRWRVATADALHVWTAWIGFETP